MAILSTDPIDFPLDPVTGDLVITNGRLIATTGLTAVVQGVRRRIQMIAGEWYLDLDYGVRWFERSGVPAASAIFGQKFDQAKCDLELRRAILATPGVTSVIKMDISYSSTTRALSVAWQARCVFGDTPVDTIAIGS